MRPRASGRISTFRSESAGRKSRRMTDIQGLRAQLGTRGRQRAARSSGGGGIAVLGDRRGRGGARLCDRAVHAALLHHAATAALAGRADPAPPSPPRARRRTARAGAARPRCRRPRAEAPASRYAGKAPEEVVRTVEIVCDERARVLRWRCVRRHARSQGGGREAALFPDRGAGALLRAQSEAQGDRRRHQLLQGHRIHQHGDHRRREAAREWRADASACSAPRRSIRAWSRRSRA